MNILLIIGLTLAIIEWYGELKENRKLIYFSKPFVMLFIIGWMLVQIYLNHLVGKDVLFPFLWFVIGMVFCLFGDVFLMGPERFFTLGLVSFLFGHIFYIVGLGEVIPKPDFIFPGLVLLGLVIFVSVRIYLNISKGLSAPPKKKLKIPVTIYSIIITIMLYAALITLLNREWNYQAAIIVSFGALFFYISDTFNAWIRFIDPIKNGRVKVMSTYHLAQFAIAIGSVLHYIYRVDS